MAERPVAVAFDIIGTVFSLARPKTGLDILGLPPLATDLLYNAALRDSFALAVTGDFSPFHTLMGAALDEICAALGLTPNDAQENAALSGMSELLPYEDAEDAFKILLDANVRVIALSNGAVRSTAHLLERAGLAGYVEIILSAADVRRSKPAREVYLHAAAEAHLLPGQMALVASHPWDIQGAQAAGFVGAFVSRGMPYPQALGVPDVIGRTLLDVAELIAEPPMAA